jgi:hypothetical protein
VGPGDVLQSVFDGNAMAAATYFSASHDRWTLFVDAFGGGMKVDVDETIPTDFCTVKVNAKNEARFVLTDFAVGYRLGQWAVPRRERPVTLGVYAGARFVHLGTDLTGGVAVVGGKRYAGTTEDTSNWADPIIGVRWSVPVLADLSATFRADIGGFGASSTLDWGIAADLRYWTSWQPFGAQTYLAAGYRLVGLDRSPDGAKVDLQVRGPTLGLGFVF